MATNIQQLPTQVTGAVGIFPNIKYMVTSDSLSAITTAGYLQQANIDGSPLLNTDLIFTLYNYNKNTTVGTFGIFTVNIAVGTNIITLSEWTPTGVSLPTTANYAVITTNTEGQLANPEDNSTTIIPGVLQLGSGETGNLGALALFPTSTTQGVLLFAASPNAGNFNVVFTNTVVSANLIVRLPSPSVEDTTLVCNDGTTVMQPNSNLILAKENGAVVAAAVTINAQAGIITVTDILLSESSLVIDFTNSFITQESVISLSIQNSVSENTTAPLVINVILQENGSCSIVLINASPTTPTAGDIGIGFVIF